MADFDKEFFEGVKDGVTKGKNTSTSREYPPRLRSFVMSSSDSPLLKCT